MVTEADRTLAFTPGWLLKQIELYRIHPGMVTEAIKLSLTFTPGWLLLYNIY